MLVIGLDYFAQANLRAGGFVTALWMLTLLAFGFRIGRVGEGETLRQVSVVGLLLTVLVAQSIILAGKLLIRRTRLSMAASEFRQAAHQISSVPMAILIKDGDQFQNRLWPVTRQLISWIWATMLFFSLLFLIYLHLGSGPKGWIFLFLGPVSLIAAIIVGRSRLGEAISSFTEAITSSCFGRRHGQRQ